MLYFIHVHLYSTHTNTPHNMDMYMSHPRQLIFLWKSDYLGCAVLLCLNFCLFDLACFFLPSFFISLINMYMYMWYTCIYTLYMYYFPLPPLQGEPPSSDVCHARGAQRLDILGGVHCGLQVQGQVHRLLPHRNHTLGHPQHWYVHM